MWLVLCALAQTTGGLLAGADSADDATSAEYVSMNWPSFRGPWGNGLAIDANPPLNWSVEAGKNVLWKTEVPKPGMSSPVIWGSRLFVTGGDRTGLHIYCYETETGQLLWRHDVDGIPGSAPLDELSDTTPMSGLAAPTATTNGRYVAAIFATGDLVTVNMDGERVWARNLGVPQNPFGHTSSLISHSNLLFVQYDQQENSKLLAVDLASGDLVWQAERGLISWSSPILVDNNRRMELVLTNSEGVDSYDPTTGELLWNVSCLSGEVTPSAAYADGVVYVANEYASASAIDIGNHGTEPEILWQWVEILPDVASPVANEDYVIMASGYGVVDCLDAKTGEVRWEQEFDDGFYSSPVVVNDRVYAIDRSGGVHVLRMSDNPELLATTEIGEEVNATPAFVGDRIYIRGATHLYCIGERK
jgi:outer membrane protein assembly factor BamB